MCYALEVSQFSFAYSYKDNKEELEMPLLHNISFKLEPGSFNLLCGKSGSGKTTLLRCLKPELAVLGKQKGLIKVFGQNITDLSLCQSVSCLGFVMYDPQSQIVTDTVWHELAFGLENIGLETKLIRRRVAEIAHFFGMGSWFNKKTSELSGGQKQLLNLASVLVMQPRVLILDEPTAQLDPISAKNFIQVLYRVNRELGTTIVICEHILEDVLPLADTVLFLDEGKLVYQGNARDFCKWCIETQSSFFDALPAASRIAAHVKDNKTMPLSVREGRDWLNENLDKLTINRERNFALQCDKEQNKKDLLLEAKNIWFRYDKKSDFILQDFSCQLKAGQVHALLGANGCGKTTALKMLSRILKQTRGKIKCKEQKRISFLPQDPRTLFVCDTLWEDLHEWQKRFCYSEDKIQSYIEHFDLEHLKNTHPFDLSGGELQKAALVKVLLLEPDILLLDEPVKSLDVHAKKEVGIILRECIQEGRAVCFATHDLDFAAQFADICSMIFAGEINCTDATRNFFTDNLFFSTATSRITHGFLENCIVPQDVAQCHV